MKISWSPLAVERLEDIYEYIAIDNSSAAQKMVKSIFKKVEALAENPKRGRIVSEANREEIRGVFEGEYRIIYRVESKKTLYFNNQKF